MSIAMTIRIPEFMAERLSFLSESSNLSKTDLILEGLESVFNARLDKNVTYLTDHQFNAVLDLLEKPIPEDVQAKREKLLSQPYPWEQ